MNLFEKLKFEQTQWLADRGATFDAHGYTATIEANLRHLSEQGRAEIAAGSGQELGAPGRAPKLAAPWSSTALVVNTFDFWRGRDLRLLAAALGSDRAYAELRQEAQFPTGLRGTPPNLDVVLDGERLLAIESKFLEPYQHGARGKVHDEFRESYFDDANAETWRGLENLHALARAIASGDQLFRWVEVPQLIKHALGLRRTGRAFELLLLWYCPTDASREALEIERELVVLRTAMAADGVAFRTLTHQELFIRLRDLAAGLPDAGDYLAYLGGRYFGARTP